MNQVGCGSFIRIEIFVRRSSLSFGLYAVGSLCFLLSVGFFIRSLLPWRIDVCDCPPSRAEFPLGAVLPVGAVWVRLLDVQDERAQVAVERADVVFVRAGPFAAGEVLLLESR